MAEWIGWLPRAVYAHVLAGEMKEAWDLASIADDLDTRRHAIIGMLLTLGIRHTDKLQAQAMKDIPW